MSDDLDSESYARYLQQRSMLGKLYRNALLYPRLNACLRGETLDYGCGIGDFLRFRPGTVGVDINSYNVEFCQKLGLLAELIRDGHIPFPDRHFDCAVMDNVLEHILPQEAGNVLNELQRVLKPGGRLLIGVPGQKGFQSDADHKCFYSERDLTRLMTGIGCRCLKMFHMPFKLPWLGKHMPQYCIYGLYAMP